MAGPAGDEPQRPAGRSATRAVTAITEAGTLKERLRTSGSNGYYGAQGSGNGAVATLWSPMATDKGDLSHGWKASQERA